MHVAEKIEWLLVLFYHCPNVTRNSVPTNLKSLVITVELTFLRDLLDWFPALVENFLNFAFAD